MPVPLDVGERGQAALGRPLVACALRLERAAVGRVLVHDAAGHGSLPLALVLVPRLARRAVGARAGGLARGRERGPPRAADRRLRRHRLRLDRLLVREPPHLVRLARAAGRRSSGALYDELDAAAGRSQELLTAAIAEGQKHVLALEEMTAAEKAHGYISRAAGPGPVPRARPRGGGARGRELRRRLPRGPGPGPALHGLRPARRARPADGRAPPGVAAGARGVPRGPQAARLDRGSSCAAFRQVFDGVPWSDVRETLHAEVEVPAVPAYSDFVDRAASGQEDLVIAFTELFTGPDQPARARLHARRLHRPDRVPARVRLRPVLLRRARSALGRGRGRARRGRRAGVRARPAAQGRGRAAGRCRAWSRQALSPGERQLCLVLASRGLAAPLDGGRPPLLPARRRLPPAARRVAGGTGLALQAASSEATSAVG